MKSRAVACIVTGLVTGLLLSARPVQPQSEVLFGSGEFYQLLLEHDASPQYLPAPGPDGKLALFSQKLRSSRQRLVRVDVRIRGPHGGAEVWLWNQNHSEGYAVAEKFPEGATSDSVIHGTFLIPGGDSTLELRVKPYGVLQGLDPALGGRGRYLPRTYMNVTAL